MLVLKRPLKDTLERRTYKVFTDSLQTTADPSLAEEMRWLAMYPEAGWNRPGPNNQMSFILMIMRGKAYLGILYLGMLYSPADLPTLEHATKTFIHACKAGLSGFAADIFV